MFTLTSRKIGLSFVPILALAGCGLAEQYSDDNKSNNEALAAVEQSVQKEAVDDGKIACAVSGATAFARVCQIEQSQTEAGLLLTIRHPDGGFRKFQVVKDGRGVIAADGADTAKVTPLAAKEIEVALSGDRYRIPATVKPSQKSPAAPAPASALPAVKPKS
jgi:hypothetical protein